jgi:hypothetical protein
MTAKDIRASLLALSHLVMLNLYRTRRSMFTMIAAASLFWPLARGGRLLDGTGLAALGSTKAQCPPRAANFDTKAVCSRTGT